MGLFGQVKAQSFDLIETGEYVFSLDEIDYQGQGEYGESLIWKWLIAPTHAPTDYICKSNGDEVRLYQFTKVDLVLGSKQHEWAQLLSGRTLAEGDEPPDSDELVGKRMVAYLTHYVPKQGKNAGNKKEQIVQGSGKPFKGMPAQRANPPTSIRSEPPVDTRRPELVAKLERLIGRAVKLDADGHRNLVAIDIEAATEDELEALILSAQEVVDRALDAA